MSATTEPRIGGEVGPRPRTKLALGRLEGLRLLRHPVVTAGFAWWLVVVISSQVMGTTAIQRWDLVTVTISFFPGVLTILAGHMVATRDLRAGSLDMLACTPARADERVQGLCIGAIVPALTALGLTFTLLIWQSFMNGLPATPSIWHVSQGSVTVLGGSLLGIMLGVWFPSRATPVIAMVLMVGFNGWVSELDGPARMLGPLVSWADWGPHDGTVWVGLLPGSAAIHVFYLLGLCGLAASAAMARVSERRGIPITGALLSASVAAVAGLAQVP